MKEMGEYNEPRASKVVVFVLFAWFYTFINLNNWNTWITRYDPSKGVFSVEKELATSL